MDSLTEHRKTYAQIVKKEGNLTSEKLVKAFALVPREKFLGPGPWKIFRREDSIYQTTPDDNPVHLYQNEVIAIDAKRYLNNGRLLFPLTVDNKAAKYTGMGYMLKVRNVNSSFSAHFVTLAGYFHCVNARSKKMNRLLKKAYGKGNFMAVKRLRKDPHRTSASCWLHGKDFCLSM